MSHDFIRKERFQEAYAGKAPWEIGGPQPAFVSVADQVTGSVLDCGCGTGENALFFAERGHAVTGIDFLERPLAESKRKAEQRRLQATFVLQDALALSEMGQQFDSVIDCGLLHVFMDQDRGQYVKGLATVVKPGGKLFLMCFSDKEPPGDGPRRVSRQEIHTAFAEGWQIESIDEVRFELRPDLEDMQFSEGGPYAWFCVIRSSA